MSDLLDRIAAMRQRAQFLLRRRSFYRATFNTDHGRHVLADLKSFARAGESPLTTSTTTNTVDAIATAVRIGRQEMFQRIVHHLHIDDKDLLNLKEENHE